MKILSRLIGSRNDRLLKSYRQSVTRINDQELHFAQMSDEQLQGMTAAFRDRLGKGEKLDALVVEAFACVREASRRVTRMRHFDVQMIGAMALHAGRIAEMRTGEGKTLTSTLAVYLNALPGRGVHVVTVNDYLAERDAKLNARLFNWLGLSVGVTLPDMAPHLKREAYACDITYGTNNEFGFDYLRDNMAMSRDEQVQRGLEYAIIDEVDSVLIDEARTPLIISGATEDGRQLYEQVNLIVPALKRQTGTADHYTGKGVKDPGDFVVDEKARNITLTEQGHDSIERLMVEHGLLPQDASLYDPAHVNLVHHVLVALKAHHLYKADQHYVVQDGEKGTPEVVIVDDFTGRLMKGRRWSDGIHQAVEAKEGVEVQPENQTMASITFQNYFRLYKKIAGMTGTAATEAFEFAQIYGMETVSIPTHRPIQRVDQLDRVYKTAEEKYEAVVQATIALHGRQQPVLVGTASVESSERVSRLLEARGVTHEVLNAKNHSREAEIISQAGRAGAITIATNMAGRGTDIVLGGNIELEIAAIESDDSLSEQDKPQQVSERKEAWLKAHEFVKSIGGLAVIGTERHESRRVDNQLRGRCGRQGDPGTSCFFVSLEDPLMRIFAGDRVRSIMDRLNLPHGEAIESGMLGRSIESAQRRVEEHNFTMRKEVLTYDDVASEQRKLIYEQRQHVLESQQASEYIEQMREDIVSTLVEAHIPPGTVEEQWDLKGLQEALKSELAIDLDVQGWVASKDEITPEHVLALVMSYEKDAHATKRALVGDVGFAQFEKQLLLSNIDHHWRSHLQALAHLKDFIHLRSYAQKQPKDEFKRDAFEMYGLMLKGIQREVTRSIAQLQVEFEAPPPQQPQPDPGITPYFYTVNQDMSLMAQALPATAAHQTSGTPEDQEALEEVKS